MAFFNDWLAAMFLLAGLGNPGTRYEGTRHNAGFMAIHALQEAYNLNMYGSKFHGLNYKGIIDGHDVLAMMPQTFMNKSGVAVGEAARFFKIPPSHIIVFYDELDLVTGKCRIKCGGGHGGHNGIKDIDRAIGKDYWRVRMGIDHPGRKEQVTSYVLGKFSSQEEATIQRLSDSLARHIPLMLGGSHEKLMTAAALDMQD